MMAVEHVHGPELATDRTLSKEEALQRDVIEALRSSLAGDRQLTHQLMDRVWSMIYERVQVALVSWDALNRIVVRRIRCLILSPPLPIA